MRTTRVIRYPLIVALMSWLTARWKYYQIRKRGIAAAGDRGKGPAPGGPERAGGPFTAAEEDFLGSLAELVTSSRDFGQDIVPFIRGLSRMSSLSRVSAYLKEERDRHMVATRKDAEALAGVCRFLEGWLSLSQVDRVGSLKAFSDQLATELARLLEVRDRLAAT